MEVNGAVKFRGETFDVGTSGFQKRELVITTEEQYPQDILINFVQDKCNLIQDINIGDKVKVFINLRGRGWVDPDMNKNPTQKTSWFNDIQGWKIEKTGSVAPPAQQAAAQVQRKFVFTATDATYEAYKAANWTDALLVQEGKGHYANVTPAPPAQQPAPAPVAPNPNNGTDPDLPF
jgi:hypothetical protein